MASNALSEPQTGIWKLKAASAMIVDTMGNIVPNVVHTANIHDSKGAHLVMKI